MSEIEKTLDNLQFQLQTRGMKPKIIRPSYSSFYNSNSLFFEKPIQKQNNNIYENPVSYSLSSKNTNITSNRSFIPLNQSNRNNFNPYKSNTILNGDNNYNTNESFRNRNIVSFRNTKNTISNNNRYNNYNENTIIEKKKYYFEPLYGSYEYETRKLIEHELGPYINNVRNKIKVDINDFQRNIKDIKNKTNEIDIYKNLVEENKNKINEIMVDIDYMNRNFNNSNRQLQENIEITKKKYFDLEKNIYNLESNCINLKSQIKDTIEKEKKFGENLELFLKENKELKSKENKKNDKFEEIIKSQIIDIQNISSNNKEISDIINNINKQIYNIKEDMKNLNQKIEGNNFDNFKKKSIISSNNNINKIYKQLELLKQKNDENSKRLNKINEKVDKDEFEIPKESIPLTELNDNENKLTKNDLKKIEEFENSNFQQIFENYKNKVKIFKNQLKNYNQLLNQNIEKIINDIMEFKKQIHDDEEIYQNNINEINNKLNNNNLLLNQLNELKQDITNIKNNDNIIEDLKKRIEILENKI